MIPEKIKTAVIKRTTSKFPVVLEQKVSTTTCKIQASTVDIAKDSQVYHVHRAPLDVRNIKLLKLCQRTFMVGLK